MLELEDTGPVDTRYPYLWAVGMWQEDENIRKFGVLESARRSVAKPNKWWRRGDVVGSAAAGLLARDGLLKRLDIGWDEVFAKVSHYGDFEPDKPYEAEFTILVAAAKDLGCWITVDQEDFPFTDSEDPSLEEAEEAMKRFSKNLQGLRDQLEAAEQFIKWRKR